MIRLLTAFLACLLPLGAALAQAPKPAPTPAPAISADQAKAALDVLNDPQKRAAFTATLDAIVKGHPAPAPAPTPEPPPAESLPIPFQPDSIGAQVLVTAADFIDRAGEQIVDALQTVQSLPLLYGWAVVMVTNPIARDMVNNASWRLIVALVVAIAVEYGLRYATRRPIARIEALAPHPANDTDDTEPEENPHLAEARAEAGDLEPPSRKRPPAWEMLRRLPLVAIRMLLELVPVIGFAAAGHLVAGSPIGGQTVSRLIILAVTDAVAVSGLMLSVTRMLFSPTASRLRLVNIRTTTARYVMRWARRLILITVFGYALGEVGRVFGLSDVVYVAWHKAVGLVLHVCLAIIVLQKRRVVRHWLRAPEGATGTVAWLRNGLARIWHWVALFLLVAGWLVWAVEMPHGFSTVMRLSLLTALLMVGARLTLVLLLGLTDRWLRLEPETPDAYPGIAGRIVLYHPVLNLLLRGLVYVATILGLLQLYGTGVLDWLFGSAIGRQLISSLGTLAVTIGIAIAIWEAVNLGFQRHLFRLQRDAQLAKSARLRTLLPLLRTTLTVTIAVVAGLMVLSQIGVNIAPLLAGAGIVGVAIGFGSQKLVQDLITGIFLLLENAMQVGDWVTVSGLSGSVEALSVRTIRLRAADGSVHIIPFSAVTSVTNVNRGIGNASVSVTVEFDEDTDRVCALLKEIVAGMRQDPDFATRMLGDLNLWGVDKVDGAGVTIAGQVVCTDSGRWPVQREFNRRMKMRFQQEGIRIFNPNRTYAVSESPGRQEDPAHERPRAAD